MTPAALAAGGAAALAAGLVNALAGGGSLVTFPVLVALGLSPVAANVTSTVALCPGHLGATWAQRGALAGQRGRLVVLVPAAALGGLGGAALLLAHGPAFAAAVPYLILAAALLLAASDRVRAALVAGRGGGRAGVALALPACTLAAVYGGYFGAGLGVILLAALGVTLGDALPRLNAAKQALALAANLAAAGLFAARGGVAWPLAATMAVAALAGGALGGRLAGRLPAGPLRAVIVAGAVVMAGAYLLRR